MLPVAGPEPRSADYNARRDHGVTELQGMALPVMSEVFPGPAAKSRIGGNTDERVKESLHRYEFGWPGAGP